MASKIHRLVCARHADMNDERDPPSNALDCGFGELLALLHCQIQRLRKVQIDAERCRVVPEEKFDHSTEGVEVDLVV
jgi:hypothetical protein